jgi:hypothetical protein
MATGVQKLDEPDGEFETLGFTVVRGAEAPIAGYGLSGTVVLFQSEHDDPIADGGVKARFRHVRRVIRGDPQRTHAERACVGPEL